MARTAQPRSPNGIYGATLDESKREQIVEALRGGLSREDACKLAGVNRSTVYRARMADPEFGAALNIAEAEATSTIVGIIWKAATRGDVKAAIWWLEHRRPNIWGSRAAVQDYDARQDDVVALTGDAFS